MITCEHAGNSVPAEYRGLFPKELLEGHRGYDLGAVELANYLAVNLKLPLLTHPVTRLLVDVNRSLHNPSLFSECSRDLDHSAILEKYYQPYRASVEALIRKRKPLIHLSVHSFTPIWKGVSRKTDIGLLYDPKRPLEKAFCLEWQQRLQKELPGVTIQRNAPYRGNADGLTTAMRRLFSPEEYLGIELEVNQKYPFGNLQKAIGETFHDILSRQPSF